MWRSSPRRVSSLFLNVSSFFLSMILPKSILLGFDRSLPRNLAPPPHTNPFRMKSNSYPKRERERRQLEGSYTAGRIYNRETPVLDAPPARIHARTVRIVAR